MFVSEDGTLAHLVHFFPPLHEVLKDPNSKKGQANSKRGKKMAIFFFPQLTIPGRWPDLLFFFFSIFFRFFSNAFRYSHDLFIFLKGAIFLLCILFTARSVNYWYPFRC